MPDPMPDWLDPETKAILSKDPPDKGTLTAEDGFTLVLIERGNDPTRVRRALERILPTGAGELVTGRDPRTVQTGLSENGALFGQFELISCDALSVFVRDNIARDAESAYLRELYSQLRHSVEFESVRIAVDSVPDNPDGDAFLDQFLGVAAARDDLDRPLTVPRKKARIMAHWARKIGAEVSALDGEVLD